MEERSHTNLWLVTIVAIIAIVGLVILYMNTARAPAQQAVAQPLTAAPSKEGPVTGQAYISTTCFDTDKDGTTTCRNDCDDGNPDINPDAKEICDGIDNNCDSKVDTTYTTDDGGWSYFWTVCTGGCTDTDGGLAKTTEGRAFTSTNSMWDKCLDGGPGYIYEAACAPRKDGGMPTIVLTTCPSGFTCRIKPGGYGAICSVTLLTTGTTT